MSVNHSTPRVSWFKLFNASHRFKPGFLVLSELLAHHSPGFGQLPAGRDQNFHCHADCADGWYFLTGLQRKSFLREKQSRNPAGSCECEAAENKKGRPGGCHMVRLPFDACGRETASIFNISQPLVCSGSLLPYSYSDCVLFIHEPLLCCQLIASTRPSTRPQIAASGSCHSEPSHHFSSSARQVT